VNAGEAILKSISRLLLSSITGVACEKLVGAAAAIAGNHLFANIYGPRLFGELQFALSLSSVIGSIALVFSAQAVAPMLGKHLRLRHLVFYRTFRLRLTSTLSVMLLFAVGACLIMNHTSAEFAVVGATMLIVEPFAVGTLMAYAERRPWTVTRARTLASGVRVLWLYAAAHLSAGAVIASMAWPIEACIAVLGPFCRYRKLALQAPKSLRGDGVVKQELLVRGVKFWPAIAAGVLILRLDRILLAMLMSKADLGIYSAAASLVEQWNSVGAALALALAPSMVFMARNEVQLSAKALRLAGYLALLAVFAFIFSLAVGHAAFLMIYGESFKAGAPVMIFATGCSIVVFADAGLTTWLIAARRYRLILAKQGMTLGAILVSPFVVPHAAVMYAPATATAMAMAMFWCTIYGRRTYRASRRSAAAVDSVPRTPG
jgi:O-antigen/teichoic acid export membrane protein